MADLKRKSARGGAVTVAAQGLTIAIQLASTVILARLLSPQDYGIIAMVLAVTNFAGVFRDLGLSSAAIQKKDLTASQQTNLFWLNVAMGAALTVLVAAASPQVAWFYGKPELFWVTFALSFNFLIGSIGSQHGAMLVRQMRFARQGLSSICGALANLAVSVVLAIQEWSYWSLVWGSLSGAMVTTTIILLLSPFRPRAFTMGSGIREMLKFGANVTAFDIVNYFHRNLDNVLIGKVWGPDALGLYSRAYSLLMLPLSAVRAPINSVGYPALSQLQTFPDEFRRYCRSLIAIVAFLSMPLVAFLGASAHLFISFALGPGWEQSAQIFLILSFAAFIQPVSSIRGMVMLSTGKADRYLRWGIANAVLTSAAFCAGVSWGPQGVATAYVIATLAILYPSIRYAFRDTPVKAGDFFGLVLRPFVTSLGAAAVIVAIDMIGISFSDSIVYLIFRAAVFFVAYITFNFFTRSGRCDIYQIFVYIKTVSHK